MYTKKNFEHCLFNPLAEQRLMEKYPALCEIIHPEWNDDPYLDNILRYIIMVYDPKSPLVFNERDLNHRKNNAAELSRLPQEEETILENIFNCTYSFFGELVVRYLMRFAKSKEWAAICAFEASFWESIRMVMEPISGKDSRQELDAVQKKSAIKSEIDQDIKRLDAYYRSFFSEDEFLEKVAKKRITPEKIANSTK